VQSAFSLFQSIKVASYDHYLFAFGFALFPAIYVKIDIFRISLRNADTSYRVGDRNISILEGHNGSGRSTNSHRFRDWFFSMFLPIISISGLIIGTPFIVWGVFAFWFGAGQGTVKVVVRAAGVKTDKGRF